MAKHSKFYIHFCKVLKICRIPQIKNFSPTFFGLFCQSSYYSYISSQKVLRCFLKCFSMVPYLDFFSGRHMGQHQTFSMHFLSPQDINPQRVQFNGWYTIKAEKEGQTVIVFSYKLNLSIASLKNRSCSSTSSWKMNFSFNDWKLAEQKGIWPIEPSILFSHMMHSKHKAAAASSRPLFFKPSKIMVGCAIHTTKERRRRRWSAGGTLGKTWL